eukprot:5586887-Alexandrium_andersonii.AAC.1
MASCGGPPRCRAACDGAQGSRHGRLQLGGRLALVVAGRGLHPGGDRAGDHAARRGPVDQQGPGVAQPREGGGGPDLPR